MTWYVVLPEHDHSFSSIITLHFSSHKKHMEHFSNEDIFLEQVGFFHKILSLSSSYVHLEGYRQDGTSADTTLMHCKYDDDTHLKTFFVEILGYDIQFWREIEYLISDMNCFVTHLVQVSYNDFLFRTLQIFICSVIISVLLSCEVFHSENKGRKQKM